MLTLEEAILDKTTPIECHAAYLTTLQHPSDDSSHSINRRSRNRSRPRNNQNQGGNHRYHGDPCVLTHKFLLLGTRSSRNNNIPLTNSGVGLRHHGSCLCAHILLLCGFSILLIPINKAVWASVLRLTLQQRHQHPLTLQLICIPCLSLLLITHGTSTWVLLPT